MKRMNLLPPELRPRQGSRRGSAYILVAVLAASILAMLAYGVVISGVRSDESELLSLKEEAEQAQARADALSPYGEFADMKERRERSVRTVADTRFDYERLTRELTRILPGGVWISHLDVAPAPPSDNVVQAGVDSPTGGEDGPPAMKVSGCAPNQDVVADTLDRLRALTGATNVSLGSSSHADSDAPDAGGNEPYLVSGSGGSASCGRSGRPRVAFDATVVLRAPGEQLTETPAPGAPGTTPTASKPDPTGAGS